jgi:hypothetical protein
MEENVMTAELLDARRAVEFTGPVTPEVITLSEPPTIVPQVHEVRLVVVAVVHAYHHLHQNLHDARTIDSSFTARALSAPILIGPPAEHPTSEIA